MKNITNSPCLIHPESQNTYPKRWQTQSESSGASLKVFYLFCLAVEGLGISAKERQRKKYV